MHGLMFDFKCQDPAPPVATFSITSYESPVRSLQRITGILKNTPVLGSDVTESRIGKQSNTHAMSTSRKIKASSVSLGPTEPPSKRQKQVLVNSQIDPYLFFNHLCGIGSYSCFKNSLEGLKGWCLAYTYYRAYTYRGNHLDHSVKTLLIKETSHFVFSFFYQ